MKLDRLHDLLYNLSDPQSRANTQPELCISSMTLVDRLPPGWVGLVDSEGDVVALVPVGDETVWLAILNEGADAVRIAMAKLREGAA